MRVRRTRLSASSMPMNSKVAALALVGLLAAGVAQADTNASATGILRYVTPLASGSGNGGSLVDGWTMAQANANVGNLAANDNVCVLISPGTYAASINPVQGRLGGNHIVYCGARADSTLANVASITINVPNVGVRWVRANGGVRLGLGIGGPYNSASCPSVSMSGTFYSNARSDSIAGCYLGGIAFDAAKVCVAVGNYIAGQVAFEGPNQYRSTGGCSGCLTDEWGIAWTDSVTFRRNIMDTGNVAVNDASVRTFSMWYRTYDCVIDSNQITTRFQGGTSSATPVFLWVFNSKHNSFKDNHWRTYANSIIADSEGPYVRDSSSFNTFVRDTFEAMTGGVSVYPVASGSCAAANIQSNAFTDCVMWLGGGSLHLQDACQDLLIQRCVISGTNSPIVSVTGAVDSLNFAQNSVFTEGAQAIDVAATITNATITNNVFYGQTSYTGSQGTVARFKPISAISDSNCYFGGGGPCTAALINGYGVPWGVGSGQGCGTSIATYSGLGIEAHTLWGDPLFGSVSPKIDPSPQIGSRAISSSFRNGRAGMKPNPHIVVCHRDGSTANGDDGDVFAQWILPFQVVGGTDTTLKIAGSTFTVSDGTKVTLKWSDSVLSTTLVDLINQGLGAPRTWGSTNITGIQTVTLGDGSHYFLWTSPAVTADVVVKGQAGS